MDTSFSSPWSYIQSDAQYTTVPQVQMNNFNIEQFIKEKSFENKFLPNETHNATFYSSNYTKDESSYF